ncbi:MAG: hypothetical protein ACLQVX_05985 [Limisphaerales bacterium]
MRKPRPIVYSLDEVIITRDATTAHIKYKDAAYGETFLTIGPEIADLTDQEIVDLYNDTLRSQAEMARNFKYVAVEPPLGSPQITYHPSSDQWTPRGGVLRCLIEDGAEGGREPVVTIDNKELSWAEFGTMLCTYTGWGMRIEFTPDDAIHRRPKLVVREPKK